MMWWFDGPPGWGHVIMMVGTLLFWAAILLVVVAAAFRLPRSGPHRPVHEPLADPEQVLAQRLARGDIEVAEYRARLEVLRGGPPIGSRR